MWSEIVAKISIPDGILNKPAPLSKEEYAEIKKHSALGADLFSNIESLKEVSKIIRHHHEWYNGEGYPDGLTGEEIPLGSRIISIADAYQAMTSDRPYRKAFSKEKAIAELERGAGSQFDPKTGSQFDPKIVRIFIGILLGERGNLRKD